MAKTFFIPNKQSILGEQEILTAKVMRDAPTTSAEPRSPSI